MPCRDETHEHNWPSEGMLHISRCEIFCGYCEGEDAEVVYQYPWNLRDHVRKVHRAQGLSITVSPQAPKAHTSVKRKHGEMEDGDSDEDEDEDDEDEESEDNESSGSEYHEDDNKKGKGKAKVGIRNRAPSDPFVANGTEDATSSAKSLRAKPPAGQPEKSPMKGHAASYKPIGPSSPKRPGQTAMGPPSAVPTTNSTGPALLPHQQQYQQMLQDLARANRAHLNNNGSGPATRPQQVASNGQPTAGNVRAPAGSMAPPNGSMGPPNNNMGRPNGNMTHPNGSMGPPNGNMAPRNGNMGPSNGNMGPPMNPQGMPMPGQTYGRVHPATGQSMPPNQQPGQIPQAQPNFYTTHPRVITPATGPPNHQRLRLLTTHMLTQGMTEQSVINHYQQEIEFIRNLQHIRLMTTIDEHMYPAVMQQVRQQFVQPPLELEMFLFRVVEHALMRHGLIAARPPPQGPQGPPQGQQQGVQGRDSRQGQQSAQGQGPPQPRPEA